MTEQEYRLLERAEQEGGLDLAALTDEEMETVLGLTSRGYLKQRPDGVHNTPKAFRRYAKHKAKGGGEYRRYYRDLVLTMVTSLGVGLILSALFKALGLGGVLLGLLLCFFSGSIAIRL